jgi:phenylalanine-4-hydroxylase
MVQAYDQYTPDDFKVWEMLYDRQMNLLPGRADQAFLDGAAKVGFVREKIPVFAEVDRALQQHTGWSLEVVPGLIDNDIFFQLLKNKKFPAATWFRKLSQIDYLEEPDMFHDVFGHVPLLTDPDFCGYLSALSDIALQYIHSAEAIEYISRLYWYTVEFGLIQTPEGMRIYGAGILSSAGESVYALEEKPRKLPFRVDEIMDTPYIKDKFQEQYWYIESYRQLYKSIGEVARQVQQRVIVYKH